MIVDEGKDTGQPEPHDGGLVDAPHAHENLEVRHVRLVEDNAPSAWHRLVDEAGHRHEEDDGRDCHVSDGVADIELRFPEDSSQGQVEGTAEQRRDAYQAPQDAAAPHDNRHRDAQEGIP